MKHAVRVAKAKRRCRVAIVEPDGGVRIAREYAGPRDSSQVETP